jgi:hypothetical protein
VVASLKVEQAASLLQLEKLLEWLIGPKVLLKYILKAETDAESCLFKATTKN